MENLTEIVISTYPKTVPLEDDTPVIIRPLLKTDEAALLEYFGGLPPEDRLCLKEDVTDPKVIENWIYELDYDNILPLIAINNDNIVGDATLHFNPIGWTRHQAEVRLTTSTRFRVRGLGTILLQNLIDIANQLGLEQIHIEIPPVLDKAFYLFEKMGFKEVAKLQGFVKDLEGNESDLVLMVKYLNHLSHDQSRGGTKAQAM
jgi:L-amino acid N-acyltransferase YncA